MKVKGEVEVFFQELLDVVFFCNLDVAFTRTERDERAQVLEFGSFLFIGFCRFCRFTVVKFDEKMKENQHSFLYRFPQTVPNVDAQNRRGLGTT